MARPADLQSDTDCSNYTFVEAPPKPKRVLNPPKSINSSWLLFYTEELAVSRSCRKSACSNSTTDTYRTETAKGRTKERCRSLQGPSRKVSCIVARRAGCECSSRAASTFGCTGRVIRPQSAQADYHLFQNLDRRVAEMRVQYEKDLAEYMSKVTPEMIQAENLYRRSQNRARPTKKKSKLIK